VDTLAIQIGHTIRQLRMQRKLSQVDLASRAGIHSKYLGQIERGKKNVTVARLDEITNVLEISLGDFFHLIKRQ